MLPDAVFGRLNRQQLAEYIVSLQGEIARARARLAQADVDQERREAYRRQAEAARAARKILTPNNQAIAFRMARAGMNDSEIAARLDRSKRTVQRLLKRT